MSRKTIGFWLPKAGLAAIIAPRSLAKCRAETLSKSHFQTPWETMEMRRGSGFFAAKAYSVAHDKRCDYLKPIFETIIVWYVAKLLYEAENKYKHGRSTWTWIVWQYPSMNWDKQIKFIDLASEMKFECILTDAG